MPLLILDPIAQLTRSKQSKRNSDCYNALHVVTLGNLILRIQSQPSGNSLKLLCNPQAKQEKSTLFQVGFRDRLTDIFKLLNG